MSWAFAVEGGILMTLSVVALIFQIWAMADVLRRPRELFVRAGQRDKMFWVLICAGALLFGLMGLLNPRGLGFFWVITLSAAGVYLAGPREQMNLYSGRGGSAY